jgi:hypothetical protein
MKQREECIIQQCTVKNKRKVNVYSEFNVTIEL